MPVLSYSAEEKVDASGREDCLLIVGAFLFKVRGVSVEDVDVAGGNVDMVEEVVMHEGVVALGMVLGDAHVFIHVEGDHILERDLPRLVHADEFPVGADGGRSGGKAQHERLLGPCGLFVDPFGYMMRSPEGCGIVIVFDDYFHRPFYFNLRNTSIAWYSAIPSSS